jgi:hypothetical protein
VKNEKKTEPFLNPLLVHAKLIVVLSGDRIHELRNNTEPLLNPSPLYAKLIVVLTGDRIHECCKNIPPKLGHMKLAAISMMLGRFVFQNLFRGVDFELGCLIPKSCQVILR